MPGPDRRDGQPRRRDGHRSPIRPLPRTPHPRPCRTPPARPRGAPVPATAPDTLTDTLTENKRIAVRWLTLVDDGDIAAMSELTSPEWTMEGGPPDLPVGHEGLR